ncbi:MAG: limonene-1,2-epoxide hydrolase family protein [Stenotrophobium sp.]
MSKQNRAMTGERSAAAAALSPEENVIRFLQALEAQDHATVAALLGPDLRYTNVSLPTIKGGERVARFAKFALRPGTAFGVQIHRIASKGDVVMTERTDLVRIGPVHIAFWVCGTFQVRRGRIVLWRDYFDWFAATRATLRGLAGVALPRLRTRLPTDIGC